MFDHHSRGPVFGGAGYGGEFSAIAQIVIFQVGARAIVVERNGGADVQLTVMLGLGFF